MPPDPLLKDIAEQIAKSERLTDVCFQRKGAFKETYSAVTSGKVKVALKLIDRTRENPLRTEREINALERCDTPLISKLYAHGEFTWSAGTKYSWCVEEFLDGGTLSDRMASGPLHSSIVRQYGLFLAQAIEYLNSIKLVHRDIKPDNIMFRKHADFPVLVDLGLVRDLTESSLTPSWVTQGPGTPLYSAPEQLNNEKSLISWKTDQFSVGVVLGMCLTGRHPFQDGAMADHEVVQAVASRKTCADSFSENMASCGFACIVKMIEPWPVRRFSLPGNVIASFR